MMSMADPEHLLNGHQKITVYLTVPSISECWTDDMVHLCCTVAGTSHAVTVCEIRALDAAVARRICRLCDYSF